jgi:hypothetical protein
MNRLITLAASLLLCVAGATAQSKVPCTQFTVVSQDALNNVQQGLSADDVRWFEKELAKKYPGACYAQPAPSVPVVFYITESAAVHRGTRVVNQTFTQSIPISGTVTDQHTNTSDIDATAYATSTSSVAVPYSFDYGIYTLAVERRVNGGKFEVAHTFQQKGLYRTLDGIPLGGRGHHPAYAVIEDAVKWLNAGGLTDPNQFVFQAPQRPEK